MVNGDDRVRYVIQILGHGSADVVAADHERASGHVDRQSDASARGRQFAENSGTDEATRTDAGYCP